MLATMMVMLMVCFTFAACGGSDDDDPGVHILLRRFNQIQQAV